MPKRRNTLNSREAAYEEALERGDIAAMEKITAGDDEDDTAALGKRKRKRSGDMPGANETRFDRSYRSVYPVNHNFLTCHLAPLPFFQTLQRSKAKAIITN